LRKWLLRRAGDMVGGFSRRLSPARGRTEKLSPSPPGLDRPAVHSGPPAVCARRFETQVIRASVFRKLSAPVHRVSAWINSTSNEAAVVADPGTGSGRFPEVPCALRVHNLLQRRLAVHPARGSTRIMTRLSRTRTRGSVLKPRAAPWTRSADRGLRSVRTGGTWPPTRASGLEVDLRRITVSARRECPRRCFRCILLYAPRSPGFGRAPP
jgi:hypothetical protein